MTTTFYVVKASYDLSEMESRFYQDPITVKFDGFDAAFAFANAIGDARGVAKIELVFPGADLGPLK